MVKGQRQLLGRGALEQALDGEVEVSQRRICDGGFQPGLTSFVRYVRTLYVPGTVSDTHFLCCRLGVSWGCRLLEDTKSRVKVHLLLHGITVSGPGQKKRDGHRRRHQVQPRGSAQVSSGGGPLEQRLSSGGGNPAERV